MSSKVPKYCNLVNTIQKITVYETFHSFYIVGSNEVEKTFKVVKIDRTCSPKMLSFSEDMHEYDEFEIKELISMVNIDCQVIPSSSKSASSHLNAGILRTYNAYGIVGFIKFLEGYYMILITKQSPVAVLGYHVIYTIEDVNMIYIPFIDKQTKEINMDEQKYLKLFQLVDLRQNFYYSYTYDLTNTFQHNQAEIKKIYDDSNPEKVYAMRNRPCSKFLWNEFLLEPISPKLSHNWKIHLIHGYLSQSSLNIYGCNILVTLIARRSQKYAGTRFLKRGGTNEGYVANEVETEQIVHNALISSFQKGFYTSFVHVRGSIPLFWSQDPKAVPKPPINIDIVDPFATVAARHFRQLFSRFGAPMIILNLVKIREKKPQESIISNEFKLSLDYLKQFLPSQSYIEYICLDMSKLNKNPKGNVMNRLYEIAESCVEKTGFYQNFPKKHSNRKFKESSDTVNQKGVVRVNCVDCLDRTNTAMYTIGKCALAHQLHALGIISSTRLGQESICERMLIDLYEKCGDCIAQQYAGSQLVHRVDTYGKNTLASQSRDMIHTISRYYSNAFADADKQNAINIFLGIFEPKKCGEFNIWDLQTDCYLHDSFIMQPWKLPRKYIDWIDTKMFNCLPLPCEQEFKSITSFLHLEKIKDKADARISVYDNYYKPFELTAFHEIFYFNHLNTSRITNTNSTTGTFGGNIRAAILDPFMIMRKKQVATLNSKEPEFKDRLAESDDDDSDESYEYVSDTPFQTHLASQEKIRHQFKRERYNESSMNFFLIDSNLDIYKKYVLNEVGNSLCSSAHDYLKKDASWNDFAEYSTVSIPDAKRKSLCGFLTNKNFDANNFIKIKFDQMDSNPNDLVKKETKAIYENFLKIGEFGAQSPSEENIKLYDTYAQTKQLQL